MDITKLENLHTACFRGESDYIPLAVKVVPETRSPHTLWDHMLSPQKTIESFEQNNENSMAVDSDWIPVIESGFLESLVPSLFGASICRSPGGLIMSKAFIGDITEITSEKFRIPHARQLEAALEHLRYLRDHTGEGIRVIMTRFASPLDYAVMMRGGDFYIDLLLEPELSMEFMDIIADTTIRLIKSFKTELGEPVKAQTTIRGFHFPGIRLTGDAVVNLSPDLIRKFMFPIYDRFAHEFGGVMLHYCTSPAPSGHVLPVLTECGSVHCVDNWHGHKSFFNKDKKGYLQSKIAICTDLDPEMIADPSALLNGDDDFFTSVPRKGGRGIIATVAVSDKEEGRELYTRWREVQNA